MAWYVFDYFNVGFFCNPTQIVAVVQKKYVWKSCLGVADHIFTLLASAGL